MPKAGYFTVKSPMAGIVLSSDFREALQNKWVKPNEQLFDRRHRPEQPEVGPVGN